MVTPLTVLGVKCAFTHDVICADVPEPPPKLPWFVPMK